MVGNLCVCIVIIQKSYLRSATNYYLVNLAVTDLLVLMVALPIELYQVWEAWPWRFGPVFCVFSKFTQVCVMLCCFELITIFCCCFMYC